MGISQCFPIRFLRKFLVFWRCFVMLTLLCLGTFFSKSPRFTSWHDRGFPIWHILKWDCIKYFFRGCFCQRNSITVQSFWESYILSLRSPTHQKFPGAQQVNSSTSHAVFWLQSNFFESASLRNKLGTLANFLFTCWVLVSFKSFILESRSLSFSNLE